MSLKQNGVDVNLACLRIKNKLDNVSVLSTIAGLFSVINTLG